MKILTVSGPPSCGKTSVIMHMLEGLKKSGVEAGVIKFDCLSAYDEQRYRRAGVPVLTGISANMCPDHYYISNIEEGVQWAARRGLGMLVSESAGLCNRCSPHIRDVLAVCVVDCLAGSDTPRKIGPMLRFADIVVITKGDIVSQAEREVFAYRVRCANANAEICFINGITGQGSYLLERRVMQAQPRSSLEGLRLRFTMPSSLCSYCMGQTRIGRDYQMGNARRLKSGGERDD